MTSSIHYMYIHQPTHHVVDTLKPTPNLGILIGVGCQTPPSCKTVGGKVHFPINIFKMFNYAFRIVFLFNVLHKSKRCSVHKPFPNKGQQLRKCLLL